MTPQQLVDSYFDLDHRLSDHYQVCDDQRDLNGCRTCSDLLWRRFTARGKIEATPAALALLTSPEIEQREREWARDYLQRWNREVPA